MLPDALEMTLDDRHLLHHDLVADIVQLCNLMKSTSHVEVVAKWIAATFAEAARSKAAQTDSSLSDHAVDRTHH